MVSEIRNALIALIALLIVVTLVIALRVGESDRKSREREGCEQVVSDPKFCR